MPEMNEKNILMFLQRKGGEDCLTVHSVQRILSVNCRSVAWPNILASQMECVVMILIRLVQSANQCSLQRFDAIQQLLRTLDLFNHWVSNL